MNAPPGQADNAAVRANNFRVAEPLLKHLTPPLRDVDGAKFITIYPKSFSYAN